MGLTQAWHQAHRVPPKPMRRQPIKRHAAHAEVCGCRDVADSMEKLTKLGGKRARWTRWPDR